MQGNRRNFLSVLEIYVDMLLQLAAIVVAYPILLLWTRDSVPEVTLSSPWTLLPMLCIVIFSSFVFQAFSVYQHPVGRRFLRSLQSLLQANTVVYGALALLVAALFRDERREFLLLWATFAFATSTAFLVFKLEVIRDTLHFLRRKKFVVRKVILVGDNAASAGEFIQTIASNPDYGYMLLGYVGSRRMAEIGCEKLGAFSELETILDKYKPNDVVFAIDAYDKRHLIRLVNLCEDRCIRVYFLPVIYGFFKNPRQLEQIGALPLINIHTTPLDNYANAAVKRLVDIVGSVCLIVLTSPIMLVAAIGVKISSPGPILFRQRRVGKMGKPFTILKFRSMRQNDESDTAWTTGKDPRKTRFGAFLRSTAIDELPQLFNVLAGSMSLVGPRPEIPVFVEHFKKEIPLYMVKHYVKPGMTGLAQVRGLRGDTSVEERIHADIAYIENWSLALDIGILLRTPWKAFNKNERYVEKETPAQQEHPTKAQTPAPVANLPEKEGATAPVEAPSPEAQNPPSAPAVLPEESELRTPVVARVAPPVAEGETPAAKAETPAAKAETAAAKTETAAAKAGTPAAPVPAETPAEEVSGAPDIFAPSGTPDAAADASPLSGKPVFSSDDKPEQPDSVGKEETEPSDPGERGDRT